MKAPSFNEYNLSQDLLKAIELLNYKEPTPVQEQTLPHVLEGKDIIVKSRTGSGKTASFAIPICERINWEENKPQALILTPTRELATQVSEDFFHIGRFKRIKVVALYGKAPFHLQAKQMKQKTHVVVGTPGRTLDHLEKGTWDTSEIQYLVIDEADEMLRMGFMEEVQSIINQLPKERVTLLFSATLPKDIKDLSRAYMKEPTLIEIEAASVASDQVAQYRYDILEEEKINLLEQLTILENPESCMIFCNTQVQVDAVYEDLISKGYRVQKIHGGMEQKERFQVMEDFRKGSFRYLVATDVAARGIDIDHVTHVVNYDLPEDKESYVHRIGRTGRGNKKGKAITFVSPRDHYYLKNIEEYVGYSISQGTFPDQEEVEKQRQDFKLKMYTRLEHVEEKGTKLNEEIMKLHINAGKKTKMRPVDIVGTLCNLPGITAQDIGIINILDVSTFVEILNNKGDKVLRTLQTTPIKGRLRRVTKADR
ncbi:RNA helicase [Sporanaerobium hydrogeniformans]|uniref:RNA helicase n=1 Tax=Sporanaerobium hydrogeniformans TaxID=3072179 RepID=A0AC61DCQ2_9FIRM|nr:DEAD/DEAH box helicase [Sporanaerobium hydrogeniformans]PHV70541.1 RNA helicase [Sporanaerobium hydrogeniformans]